MLLLVVLLVLALVIFALGVSTVSASGAWWADAADEFALFDERDDHVDATVWLAAAANETEAAPTATLPAAPKAHLALML